ncbi:MAG: right-handed parallel beta-helix repeat-containing protein [Planctomycetota bacterium]|nr:right-handed parallel beta-helix repeat-containing protein [Planctomycetota bacterium]
MPPSHPRPGVIDLSDVGPVGDGSRDDTAAFRAAFEAAGKLGRCTVVIPPGVYAIAGEAPVPIPSHVSVRAEGAVFRFPESLGDGARRVMFAGRDVVDFQWHGGEFVGHCFDHRRPGNTWAPNANSRGIVVETSPGGVTDQLTFSEIRGNRVGGAVLHVSGALQGEDKVHTHATRILVDRCDFDDCGKFMWDYGLLWQILVWPEEYAPADVAMAQRHFPDGYIRGPASLRDGDDRVALDNAKAGIRVSASDHNDECVCFLGGQLPRNVVRGKKYAVVEAGDSWVRIAERVGGKPIRFDGSSGPGVLCMNRLHHAYYHLYAPAGAGPGKGGLDLVGCRGVRVAGCSLKALGDTMHIQRCRDVAFTGNQIAGSRMGAFFLAEHCENATVTGNTIDGTNGSRIMSVERSCTNVTIVGNTFRDGGRGSWINQPKRLILEGNVFVNNTTKGERDPWRGRKGLETGDYERWPEMYFTRWQPEGTYGPCIIRGNIFATGPECAQAIVFHAGGHDLLLESNVFEGPGRTIRVEPGCEPPAMRGNVGIERVV